MMIGPFPGSPDKIDGGAASALTYLSQELARRREIELIGVRIADTSTAAKGVSNFEWPIVDLPLGRLGLTTLYRQQRNYFHGLLQRYRPDIVHAQGTDLPGYIAVNSGVPSVVTVHGILSEETKYGGGALERARSFLTGVLLEHPTVQCATDLISISPYVTEHYGNRIRGRVHEIPNAIAPRYFDIRRDPEKGRLLFAGRLVKRKGVIDLVRAFAKVHEGGGRLIFAGAPTDPGYERLVRQDVARLGLVKKVEFPGLLDEPRMLEEFSRAEALVLPSYQETAPMVIQQAMAAGLAVIATRICGIPYQIQHDVTGLLYTPGVVDELATLIVRIGTDGSLAKRLGEAARAAAIERYHAAKVAEATLATYESILRGHVAA
jgi:glycosyltransferase involved in cell wall biosynthesis